MVGFGNCHSFGFASCSPCETATSLLLLRRVSPGKFASVSLSVICSGCAFASLGSCLVDFLYLPLRPPPNTALPSHTTAGRQVRKTLAGYSLTQNRLGFYILLFTFIIPANAAATTTIIHSLRSPLFALSATPSALSSFRFSPAKYNSALHSLPYALSALLFAPRALHSALRPIYCLLLIPKISKSSICFYFRVSSKWFQNHRF